MNKKIFIPIILIIAIVVALIIVIVKNNNKEISNNLTNTNIENNTLATNEFSNDTISVDKVENMKTIYIKVNNHVLDVELEDNLATQSLKEKLQSEDIIIEAHDYGGFEKIGDLGVSLPREDTSITTSAGDIVLYQGNQISLFYNSNSWSYTKLGKIQNISANELKNILGSGDVSLTLTLSR